MRRKVPAIPPGFVTREVADAGFDDRIRYSIHRLDMLEERLLADPELTEAQRAAAKRHFDAARAELRALRASWQIRRH